ncbi:alpha/beta fold hydrolase [Halobacterium jilantaiense]|uniref:Pimeloyl-ACP methyl ester carboxylesterase n=1 Tax=Halobacterium jilantaiense TaxID=355548 RepID=A0A1I0P5A7_9EURY|nr:alpha/beta hydrolase [Halobacterium jilantaiense]SEW09549.1 Pimeloyl-ACP methyl ester carboxylesterase [Halobacterium jilantaiense]
MAAHSTRAAATVSLSASERDRTDAVAATDSGDERALAYAEYGDPDGTPLVFCHGFPGSRIQGSLLREAAREHGVRVLAPDRPGVGQSGAAGVRPLGAWADDVATLADRLGVDEYGVLGFSAGGPRALACAARTPERVTRCVVASGSPPPALADDLDGFVRAATRLGRHSVHFVRPLAWLCCRRIETATRFTDVVGDPQDGDLADPRLGESGRMLLADAREAVRQGPRPVAAELAALGRDWGFDLGDVAVPTRVVHGALDETVPVSAAEYVADGVPSAEFDTYDHAGHYLVLTEYAGDAVTWAAGE